MFYPINILKPEINIYPLFGNQLIGQPYIFNFSSNSGKIENYMVNDFETFQKNVFDELKTQNSKWGIGRYLEEREKLLSNFPQFVAEGRFIHLGVDIIVPEEFYLFAPLDAEIFQTEFDEGFRNYGGYIILKHDINKTVFYSFYGHLKTDFIVKAGDRIKAGEPFAQIGEKKDSGEWFTHTHLQILTQKAVDENLLTKGYCSAENLKTLEEYFPSPYFLFKY